MKNTFRFLFLAVALCVLAPVIAEAASWDTAPTLQSRDRWRRPRSTPEFDPAAIGAIAALLGGGALMFTRSRSGKK